MPTTLYWHDYETFGTDPRRDRAAQFAGLRTDEALNEIGEPLVIYCKPARDLLPHPAACLLTGITPQIADVRGLTEPEFIARIHAELVQPNTCGTGYNSVRFDDEVTRHTLYRNFYDPYAREWQQGNSRWDIIDLVRMTYALRPQGIEWPRHDNGQPSFRLEDLVSANNISHESAHDALSDVRATIGLARLLYNRQPRLYHWLFQLRNKRKALAQLDLIKHTPVVHTSRMYSAETGCTTLVMPLSAEPGNSNSVLVYDLRHDPAIFMDMEVADLNTCLFTRADDLPQGMQRLPVKSIKINKCPALAPKNTLDEPSVARIAIDLDACHRHWQQLRTQTGFMQRIASAYSHKNFESANDVDTALYENLLSNLDSPLLSKIRSASPETLAHTRFDFHDPRLPELLFRYRARNWPETLTQQETQQWEQMRHRRLTEAGSGGSITLADFTDQVTVLRNEHKDDPTAQQILDAMDAWKKSLLGS
ncbi:Exodeoxyribonuclease I subunit C [Nitrosomonas cryotolerans]|uniref:Exodeoxyribonuclease I n=1 Tax=Nitrosomonas cryotolerans ATCC 49181 TaxID=1131553 RepID=A0A1N6FKV9_9PROT|nr:exodeoxyribonuclease I [Nitrosomonas cryotolerans]SFP82300.1 Exodeoxyribonuclease I subunit C [Nitrosomonas cryotolerans]SIN95907.1 Exodeoxyribonuclease I subunit C [Nitrosomonas cryotolerans ATCC 49181]